MQSSPPSFPSAFRILALGLLLTASAALAQNKTAQWLQENFEARTHTSTTVTMAYRLFKPVGYDSTKTYPIVVALHGIGERGNNNVNQLTLEELAQPWVRDSVQAEHPHFVMIPQCPSNLFWWPSFTNDGPTSAPILGVVEILDSLKREFSLDTTRFHAVGLSMGGFGTFDLIRKYPKMFASAVPTAGLGVVSASDTIAMTPIWVFHSETDGTVDVSGSRNIVNKLDTTGYPVVYFTSDPDQQNPVAFDESHAVVSVDSLRTAVYVDSADYLYSEVRNAPGSGNALHQAGWWEAWRHPMLTDWVFSKRKGGEVTAIAPGAATARAHAPANVRLVLGAGNRVLLERLDAQGRAVRYTLEGKLFEGR